MDSRWIGRWLWLLLMLMLVACNAPATPATLDPAGRITFAGSTTVQPLADFIGQEYITRHPNVTLDIAAGGSEVGINAVREGTVDIGMVSRALREDEATDVTVHQIAVDVLAVVVNGANPVTDLTLAQLQAIYAGDITNWREVGGEPLPIVVLIRAASSGTRGAFDSIVLQGQTLTPAAREAITAGDMSALVQAEPGAIGYVGFGNLDPGTHTLAIAGVPPSESAAQNGSYPLVRPLLLITGPLTQPLAHDFIAFALSAEGQAVVVEHGWVPMR